MSDTTTTKPTRRQHVTREEEADRCLNHTQFTKGSQAILIVLFLLIVCGIPLAQHVVEIRQNLAKRSAWDPVSGQPKPHLAPQVYDVFGLLPTVDQIKRAKGFWGYWSLIPSGESISAFETRLKEDSILTQTFLSPAQSVMSGVLGVGNEKAYVGKNGWLFYRPDVEYLTSDGFLDPVRLKIRSHGSTPVQPDPVKAILDFNSQLQVRGIQLVVMPMTTKPMIHPEMLIGTSPDGSTVQNPSFSKFVQELQDRGVAVFDPTPVLLRAKDQSHEPQYLATDTHWTPAGMKNVAKELASYLVSTYSLPPTKSSGLMIRQELVAAFGDIAEMLKLPKDQTLFPRQSVTIDRVTDKEGSGWNADPLGDVLLLGDSFTNIYSLEGMGWGSSAGFAEQLGFALDRPIDKIAINAGGSFASRRALAQQLATGTDRLAGKKVVVYEFSMRDLTEGDWKMIHLARPKPVEHKLALTSPTVPTKPIVQPKAPVTATVPLKPGVTPNLVAPVKPKAGASPSTSVKPSTGTSKTTSKTPGPTSTKPVIQHSEKESLFVTGRIVARATTPKPGSVPYKDCLIALQLADLKAVGGTVKGPNIVVYVWGLRDNQLVDSEYSVGQTIRFKLTPWASVESKYGGLNRQELESDEALSWTAYWGEISR